MGNCCKLKVTIAHGRVRVESLLEDDATVDQTVADVPLVANTLVVGYPSQQEVKLVPENGNVFTIRFLAVASVVDQADVVIASAAASYDGFIAFIQAAQADERKPGLQVDLTNTDPSAVAVAANVNNQALPATGYTGLSLNVSVASDITGLVAPATEEHNTVFFRNTGSEVLTLKNDDANSDAANRFLLPGNVDKTMAANAIAIFWYDTTLTKWFLVNNF